jgi:hypothetical protein
VAGADDVRSSSTQTPSANTAPLTLPGTDVNLAIATDDFDGTATPTSR